MQSPLRGLIQIRQRGWEVHAFSWGTLTEDEGILELIQSWKQTQGGQPLGGDLAVALVRLGTGLVGWAMAGQGVALGELLIGAGFSVEGPEEPRDETQQNRLKQRGR